MQFSFSTCTSGYSMFTWKLFFVKLVMCLEVDFAGQGFFLPE